MGHRLEASDLFSHAESYTMMAYDGAQSSWLLIRSHLMFYYW